MSKAKHTEPKGADQLKNDLMKAAEKQPGVKEVWELYQKSLPIWEAYMSQELVFDSFGNIEATSSNTSGAI